MKDLVKTSIITCGIFIAAFGVTVCVERFERAHSLDNYRQVNAFEVFPIGAVYISTVSANPATYFGYGTWVRVGDGQVLVGQNLSDPDFDVLGETGGSKSVAASGTNSAPTFTGSALATHTHGAGTLLPNAHSGTAVANISYTPAGSNTAPTFTGSALAGHAHELPFTKLAGGTGALRMLAGSIFGVGTSRAPESVSAAPTANTTAQPVALSQSVSAGTPAGTVSAPTFSGTPATLVHVVTQPSDHTMSGTSSATSAGTPAGAVSAPAFTGSATSVVQPYLVVTMWKRTQ